MGCYTSRQEKEDSQKYMENHRPSYCPAPSSLVKHIKSKDWKILEMCGGYGHNYRKMKDFHIDIISFSHNACDGIQYGHSGEVEFDYPDRTLFLARGTDAERSVSTYIEAGGKRVILGGYVRKVKTVKKTKWFFPDPHQIESLIKVDTMLTKAHDYPEGEDANMLSISPDPEFMIFQGFHCVGIFYGRHGAEPKGTLRTAFHIWELEDHSI